MRFATIIKDLRIQHELTQADLAILLDVHSMTVSRWERAIRLPGPEVLLQLSSLFNVSTDYLLGVDKSPDCGSE